MTSSFQEGKSVRFENARQLMAASAWARVYVRMLSAEQSLHENVSGAYVALEEAYHRTSWGREGRTGK